MGILNTENDKHKNKCSFINSAQPCYILHDMTNSQTSAEVVLSKTKTISTHNFFFYKCHKKSVMNYRTQSTENGKVDLYLGNEVLLF